MTSSLEWNERRKKYALLAIFLTIFTNLLGFGIIIPLLPFYAQSLGASGMTIGLLFASYSICQLLAAPLLGDLSDRYGRRPILIFSLLGTMLSFALLAVANRVELLFLSRILDGLSGGNIPTARAYISDITDEKDRTKAFGLIGAAFGLGFIFGPALASVLSHISHQAPAGGAAMLALGATGLAWFWLPETLHKSTARRPSLWQNLVNLPELLRRPLLGRLLIVDFSLWATLSVYQTTFALFGERRFHFGVAQTGYLLAMVGTLGAFSQVMLVYRVVRRLGEPATLTLGIFLAALGLGGAALSHAILPFVLMLIPAAFGTALASPTLTSLLTFATRPQEQGRVQGVSSALESLGRTVGPVWGNGTLDRFGEGYAYGSAALVLVLIATLCLGLPKPKGSAESEKT